MPFMTAPIRSPKSSPPSSGARLCDAEGRDLLLRSTTLDADAKAGLARTIVRQVFENPYREPLRVSYQLPLPADAAVSAFTFTVGEARIRGVALGRQQARERFERAILEGKSGALLDQERSSLFSQEIGNIPPGERVCVEISVDHKLRWLPEGSWEWRFPSVVAPRYLGSEGRVPDAGRVVVEIADAALAPRISLALCVRDDVEPPHLESPSHPLAHHKGTAGLEVAFADEAGVALDRDVVVRWTPRASGELRTALDVARPEESAAPADASYGLLTLVPPALCHVGEGLPRDLIVLLDTSGSMSGAPLSQAQRVTLALIDALGPKDSLELIEFSMRPSRFKKGAVRMGTAEKAAAKSWVTSLRAGGGTEMHSGIKEALSPLRAEAQRQVVVITDGLIGFESEIVAHVVEHLPAGCRVHTVGIGSAVNRSLTMPLARAGRGEELIIPLGEDPERAARRIVERTALPLIVDVTVEGSALIGHAPERIPDLFAGAPALVSLKLRPEGGSLRVRGRLPTGTYEIVVDVESAPFGRGNPGVTALFARERVEDLEMMRATGKRDVDAEVERIGLEFQIATRLTSFVAVSDEVTVDPADPTRRAHVPQELAHGMSAAGLGLRAASVPMAGGAAAPVTMTRAGTLKRAAPMGAMPPPPQSPAPKRESAPDVESSRRRQPPARDELADEDAAYLEGAEEQRSEESAAAPPNVRLKGRVVLAEGKTLVLEVLLEEALEWILVARGGRLTHLMRVLLDEKPASAAEATVLASDGAALAALIDTAMSTRAGRYGPGQVLRITLVLPVDVSGRALAAVHISGAANGGVLELTL